jgi:hypothetical protein
MRGLVVFGIHLIGEQHEGGECLDDVVHIAKDKALRLVTNQQVPTPQAIGTWLRHLGIHFVWMGKILSQWV